MTIKCKAVLFDMDGTLVNTEPVGGETMKELDIKDALGLTDDEYVLFDKVWRRDGTDLSFEEYVKKVYIDRSRDTESDDATSWFFARYGENILRAKALTGATELLAALKEHGIDTALVTASTNGQARAILEFHKWESLFTVIVTHDDFEKSKPDPESYLCAAEKLSVAPEDCIVVEDSKNGALSGKNAGMYVLGVREGNILPQDLSAANEVCDTLLEIKEKII